MERHTRGMKVRIYNLAKFVKHSISTQRIDFTFPDALPREAILSATHGIIRLMFLLKKQLKIRLSEIISVSWTKAKNRRRQ